MASAARKHDEPTGQKSRDAVARKLRDSVSRALSASLDKGELDRGDLEQFQEAIFKLKRITRTRQGKREHTVVLETPGASRGFRAYVRFHGGTPAKASPRKTLKPLSKIDTPPLRGAGMGEVLTSEQQKDQLEAISIEDISTDWTKSPLLGSVEMAGALSVSRTTLDTWRKRGLAIAFTKGLRNFVFPTVQFKGRRPIEGLALVAEQFETQEEAWHWLVTENLHTNGIPPLERLRKGKVEEVVEAAKGALNFA